MSTWREEYAAIIGEAHKAIPADATLAERTKAVDAARPWSARITSHGRKTWQAVRRDYLTKFGYRKRGPELPESPMERMMRRSADNG